MNKTIKKTSIKLMKKAAPYLDVKVVAIKQHPRFRQIAYENINGVVRPGYQKLLRAKFGLGERSSFALHTYFAEESERASKNDCKLNWDNLWWKVLNYFVVHYIATDETIITKEQFEAFKQSVLKLFPNKSYLHEETENQTCGELTIELSTH